MAESVIKTPIIKTPITKIEGKLYQEVTSVSLSRKRERLVKRLARLDDANDERKLATQEKIDAIDAAIGL